MKNLTDIKAELEGQTMKEAGEMPFVSQEFIEWFVDEMKETQVSNFQDIDEKENIYNAGRNSVLLALVRFKILQEMKENENVHGWK